MITFCIPKDATGNIADGDGKGSDSLFSQENFIFNDCVFMK